MGEAKFILMSRPSTSRSDPIADIFLKANISLNTRTYNIILKGLSTKDYERSFALLEIMKRKHLPPDKITINTIISACVKNHDVRRAVEVRLLFLSLFMCCSCSSNVRNIWSS